MKLKNFTPLLIILTSITLFTCKKKEEPEPDPIPTIELVSITPSTVKEFKDSILIKIKYKDNNGDLGDASPDEHSLEVKDSRLQKADTYHVKPLAPNTGENIVIEGELTIKLNSLFLLGTGTSESTVLTIKLKDRAGHWSNEISTGQITINQ